MGELVLEKGYNSAKTYLNSFRKKETRVQLSLAEFAWKQNRIFLCRP